MDFVNVSGEADSAWLSAGIAQTVAGDLGTLGPFHVVDRWRVMEATRRTDGSLRQVARDLRARLAVVGSHQRQGDRIRITARVVDVVNGRAKPTFSACATSQKENRRFCATLSHVVPRFHDDVRAAQTRGN